MAVNVLIKEYKYKAAEPVGTSHRDPHGNPEGIKISEDCRFRKTELDELEERRSFGAI